MTEKHSWTLEEDLECCETCLQKFVVNKTDLSMSELVNDLSYKLPDISKGSLRRKVQNIKQLLEEHGIENTLSTKPLSNYSKQNARAMDLALSRIKKS